MRFTQMQQIQSLGEALSWLERELTWGVQPANLNHLCGRIGELYACVITNGQMALGVNQRGYDVAAGSGERVSVKTITQRLPCQVQFNGNTLEHVDRVIVLRINTDDMQVETLYDAPIATARANMKERDGKKLSLTVRAPAPVNGTPIALATAREASHNGFRIVELENGSIQVWTYGRFVEPAKPTLRELAADLEITTRNSRGNEYNTRQLGSRVLDRIEQLRGHLPTTPTPTPMLDHSGIAFG